MEQSGDRSPADAGHDGALLALFLSRHDVACPGCGYNLRGVTLGKCPECAKPIELWIRGEEPKRTAYMTGLIAISAGVGFHALLLAWIAWMRMIQRRGGPRLWEIWPVYVGVGAGVLMLCLWVRSRRRLVWREGGRAWAWVALTGGITLGLAALFFATVR